MMKMKRIPFNLKLAKAIANGEKEGRIVTRGNYPIKFISFNILRKESVFVVYEDEDGKDVDNTVYGDGRVFSGDVSDVSDLFLEVPEEQQFKDGYIVTSRIGSAEFVSIFRKLSEDNLLLSYVDMDIEDGQCHFSNQCGHFDEIRLATEEEKLTLIDALREDGSDKAREYLKKFFNITLPYNFEPFDKVLVRNGNVQDWTLVQYSHFSEKEMMHYAGGRRWNFCIPYNDQTKHLLGTNDDWEG